MFDSLFFNLYFKWNLSNPGYCDKLFVTYFSKKLCYLFRINSNEKLFRDDLSESHAKLNLLFPLLIIIFISYLK